MFLSVSLFVCLHYLWGFLSFCLCLVSLCLPLSPSLPRSMRKSNLLHRTGDLEALHLEVLLLGNRLRNVPQLEHPESKGCIRSCQRKHGLERDMRNGRGRDGGEPDEEK